MNEHHGTPEAASADPLRTPALGPRSRSREARMRMMITAATELFGEEGYDAVSTRRVAERAHCSETLLFRYFGGKHGLLLAICHELQTSGSGSTWHALEDLHSVKEFIEGYFMATCNATEERRRAYKVVIAALVNDPGLTAEFEIRHDEAVERVAIQLRRYQRDGQISEAIDVDAIAASIEQMGFAVGFLMNVLYGRPEGEILAVARAFGSILALGLRDATPTTMHESRRQSTLTSARTIAHHVEQLIDMLERSD